MSAVRKTKRESKAPTKLEEYAVEDVKDDEPRRSSRTPKISEKFKDYLSEKGWPVGEKYEEDKSSSLKKASSSPSSMHRTSSSPKKASNSPSSTHRTNSSPKKASSSPSSTHRTSSKGAYPKVMLKALPDSLISVRKRSPAKRNSVRPPARKPARAQLPEKRHVTSSQLLSVAKTKRTAATTVQKGQARTIKRSLDYDSRNTNAKKTKKAVQSPKSLPKIGPKSRVKREVQVEEESEESEESDGGEEEEEEEEESESEESEAEEATVPKVPRLSRDMLTRLLSFGAEVAEAIAASNDEEFEADDAGRDHKRSLNINLDREEDFKEEEVAEIVKWIEEEEAQRRAYRKQIMQSLKASHNTNMELYTQMLKVLQSATRGS